MRMILIAAVLAAKNAEACTIRLSWDFIGKRENGWPMPSSDVKQFEIRCVGVGVANSFVKFPKPTTRAYAATTSKAGKYSCVMFVHDIWGMKSKASNTAIGVCK